MEQIYEKLYEAFVPPWATPEETAAGEPYFDRLCQRFPPQEAEDIWDAALSARAAGREECFLRGFRLGALLMLDLLSGGEGERGAVYKRQALWTLRATSPSTFREHRLTDRSSLSDLFKLLSPEVQIFSCCPRAVK